MKISYHSVHQPRCWVCQKHCKSFESVREHINSPLSKTNCLKIFVEQGCNLCLKVLDSPSALKEHKQMCSLVAPVPLVSKLLCLVDEAENIILHTYVQPQIPVTNYRYEVTGLTEDHLRDAIPLNEVQDKIKKILYNGESVGRMPPDGVKARLLVGHDIQHDLNCLRMKYPGFLLRYNIQSGIHDPYEDCISVMRLYKRMRGQDHRQVFRLGDEKANSGFDSFRSMELEKKAPDELYEISTSDYKCWCLDLTKDCNPGS
ncbi:hypothetical protein Goarm_016424 [Gossypium armourianum]|uniref:Exonuclease domain-containing protein n=1 Tax=Gossypium armourianum TaxID=34283 RepID=A0A7J9JCI8_9ROSI|nr:hypothetical protein [Gossypium armourianum]